MVDERKYILWVGTVLGDEESIRNPAASPAANRWQRELLSALCRGNSELVLFSHVPQRIWPGGEFWPHRPPTVAEAFGTATWLKYWNVPGWKSDSILAALKREFSAMVKRRGRPQAVVTYNPTRENMRFGLYCQEIFATPWIDLCADALDTGPTWDQYPAGARHAWGHVFLSQSAFLQCPFPRKLHLDGGIKWLGGETPPSPPCHALLYTGMMTKWGGVEVLLRAFEQVADATVELWICGQGENKLLNQFKERDRRLRVFGMLPSAELDEVCRRAAVFVNPRPASVEGGSMNFPSKLLHYLAYGKPVVSTLTPGVSDEYRRVVIEVPAEDEAALARALEQALGLTREERDAYWQRIRAFASARTWDAHAKRLLDWINSA